MNVFSILFAFLFAVYAGVFLLGAIVAACFGKWKISLGILGAGVAGYVLLYVLFELRDPMMRRPVPMEELAATYRMSPGALEQLRERGYEIPDGELVLNPDGTFTGTRIPACCVEGDFTSVPAVGGCYAISGTWQSGRAVGAGVHLKVKSATRSEVPTGTLPAYVTGQGQNSLKLDVFEGPPYEIAFSVFDGADFIWLFFKRPPASPAEAAPKGG